jgi:hypothetical protein
MDGDWLVKQAKQQGGEMVAGDSMDSNTWRLLTRFA